MVAPNSSKERPYLRTPSNAQPPRNRNPMYWSIYSNGTDDDQAPAVPPKDTTSYTPVFPTPVSTSPSPAKYTRPRYTSFSVYEPQSASMSFPEPQPPRLAPRRSAIGLASLIRHRGSKSESDTRLSASSTSLSRLDSNRGSHVVTVRTYSDSLEYPLNSFRLAGTASSRRSP